MTTNEDDANKNKSGILRYGINNWTPEELADPAKKLWYTTDDLEQENGQFKCFSCPYNSPTSSEVVLHILVEHPKFVHRNSASSRLTGTRISSTPVNVGRGIKTWTNEELSDPNRKLCYTTSNLEKVDRRFKCFCCSFNSQYSTAVIAHMQRLHPQFVHTPLQTRRKSRLIFPRLGLKTWTEEELADPKKKLYFTSANLEKVAGRYKCFLCSYLDQNPGNIGKHVEKSHENFVFKRIIKEKPVPRRKGVYAFDSRNVRKEHDRARQKSRSIPIEKTDIKLTSESSAYESNSDGEMMDGDGHDEARSENPTLNNDDTEEREFERNDDDAVLNFTQDAGNDKDMHICDDFGYIRVSEDVYDIGGTLDFAPHSSEEDKQHLSLNKQNTACKLSNIQHSNEENNALLPTNGKDSPINTQTRSEEISSDGTNICNGKYQQNSDDDSMTLQLEEVYELKERKMESLMTEHTNELVKLKEDMSQNNDVGAVPLTDVKEEIDEDKTYFTRDGQVLAKVLRPFSFKIEGTKSRKLRSLKNVIAAKDKAFQNLKSKNEELINQLEYERAKTRENRQREEELTTKLANAESELKKYKKILELREKQEKLQLEEQLEEQRVREAERVLEERKRAKEERSKEMEIIKAELDITD